MIEKDYLSYHNTSLAIYSNHDMIKNLSQEFI